LVFLGIVIQIESSVLVLENLSDFLFELSLDFIIFQGISIFLVFFIFGADFIIEIINHLLYIQTLRYYVSSGKEMVEVYILHEGFDGCSSSYSFIVHFSSDFSRVSRNTSDKTVHESSVFRTFVNHF